MARLLTLFGRAIRAWWSELLFLLVVNFIWSLAQLTVVLGPPTTAALFGIAERVLDRELVGFQDFGRAWRESLGHALLWGLAQFVVYGILGFNLVVYAGAGGVLALALRYAWVILAFAWFAINLYYWPIYLAEKDRGFSTTLSNATKMALLNPALTAGYALVCLLFITGSVLSGVLFGSVLGIWLAFWGILVVRDRLAQPKPVRK